jgi:hypothetical protein
MDKRGNIRMNTMKGKCVLGNEDGSVLVIALVMLALLTIMGVSATTTSNIEIQVARNIEYYTQNLYMAAAAAMEAAQELENRNLQTNRPNYLQGVGVLVDLAGSIPDGGYWGANADPSADSLLDDSAQKLASSEGIVGGSSLDMGKSSVYGYTIFGRSESNNSVVIIELGYRKAY